MKKEERIIFKINIKDVVQDTAQPRQDWANNEKALLSLTEDIRELANDLAWVDARLANILLGLLD